MSFLFRKLCALVARYLQQRSGRYRTFASIEPERLARRLLPGDVLLIEGNQRISGIIKYLTQSTWSHAAFYIGEKAGEDFGEDGEPAALIEADFATGVIAVPLSTYAGMNCRICRPVGLSQADRQRVVDFMVASLGKDYDTANIIDLARYLFPAPPVPARWRRRLLALGSGDPTRAICSSLIAQAFQSVRYPILPRIREESVRDADGAYTTREIWHITHHSLFVPRDFDLSPYFEVIKPTLEDGFDYKALNWAGDDL